MRTTVTLLAVSADLPRSTRRVHDALVALGLPADIHRMADSTRTAPEAAAAVGCEVGAIVKSLVMRRWLRDGRLNQSAPPAARAGSRADAVDGVRDLRRRIAPPVVGRRPRRPGGEGRRATAARRARAPTCSRPTSRPRCRGRRPGATRSRPTAAIARRKPAPPPRDSSPDPTRDAARVDHAAISPDAFLPGRSHYRGRPPQDVPTQAPRKPPPPQRDVAPTPKDSTPRVPPIVIAAALVVAIVIAAVLLLLT